MNKFLLGKKIGMTNLFLNDRAVPVTLIEAGPIFVTQIKTKEKDGYQAAQVGFLEKRPSLLSKAVKGHLGDLGSFRFLREYLLDGEEEVKRGDKIDLSIFNDGEIVKISGISKGKGFQGGVKRYGFKGGPKTHGQKNCLRAPGAIGSTNLQRVAKGKRMAGRMGSDRITLKNSKIVFLDTEKNICAIKGSLPGKKGQLLEISAKNKEKK